MINNQNTITVNFAIGLTAGIIIPLGLPPLNFWLLSLTGLTLLFSHSQKPAGKKHTAGALGFALSYTMSGQLWVYYSQHILTATPSTNSAAVFMTVFLVPLLLALATLLVYPLLRRWFNLPPYSVASAFLFSACWILFEMLYSASYNITPLLISGYALLGQPSDSLVPIMGIFGNSLFLVLVASLLGALFHHTWRKHSAPLPYLMTALLLTFATPFLASRVEWTWSYDIRPFNYVMQVHTGSDASLDLLDMITLPSPRLAIIGGVKGNIAKPEFTQQIPKLNETSQIAYLAQFRAGDDLCPRFFCIFGEGEGCIAEMIRKVSQYTTSQHCNLSTLPLTRASITRHPAADAYRITVLSPLSDSHPFLTASEVTGSEIIIAFDSTAEGQVFREWMIKADRARALETGRPLLRYSDVGVSAEIDHQGTVQAKFLPEQDFVTGSIQPMSGQTPFMYLGPYAPLSFIVLVLVVFFYRRLFQSL